MSVFRSVYRLFIRGYSGDNEAPMVLSVESITGIYLFITGVTRTAASLGRLWDVSWSPHKVYVDSAIISRGAETRLGTLPVEGPSGDRLRPKQRRDKTGLYTALSTCGHHSLLHNC